MKIKFFASLKEKLNCDELDWQLPEAGATVEDVLSHLQAKGSEWDTTFQSGKLLIAVNQEMANKSTPVTDQDEVAFFPPVTGG